MPSAKVAEKAFLFLNIVELKMVGGWCGMGGGDAAADHFRLPMTGCGISHHRWLLNSRDLMASSTRFPVRHPPPQPAPLPAKKSSPFIGSGTHPYFSPPPLEEMAGPPICVCSGFSFFWKMHQCFPNGKSNRFQKEDSCGG